MADPKHDDTIEYDEETVDLTEEQLKEWKGQQHGKSREVIGFCPKCRAPAGAVVSPPTEPIGVEAEPPEEIAVLCDCQYEHGKKGATNCGRSWVVPWSEIDTEAV